MEGLAVNERIVIPEGELRVSFARSGGPGGQNVNKVETKVELRWNPSESAVLDDGDRNRLIGKLASRLTSDGDLIVTSSRTRDQGRNREDARGKLVRLLNAALEKPKPRKRTRPSRAAVENRLKEKKERSRVKESRRGLSD